MALDPRLTKLAALVTERGEMLNPTLATEEVAVRFAAVILRTRRR